MWGQFGQSLIINLTLTHFKPCNSKGCSGLWISLMAGRWLTGIMDSVYPVGYQFESVSTSKPQMWNGHCLLRIARLPVTHTSGYIHSYPMHNVKWTLSITHSQAACHTHTSGYIHSYPMHNVKWTLSITHSQAASHTHQWLHPFIPHA
jgi:hypothetical protein